MSDDERIRSRNAILARRAKYFAAALAGATLTSSCGGKVEGDNEGGPEFFGCLSAGGSLYCLTAVGGVWGYCLSPPCEPQYGCDPYGDGGASVCLSVVCLSGAGPCLEPGLGGYGGDSQD